MAEEVLINRASIMTVKTDENSESARGLNEEKLAQ